MIVSQGREELPITEELPAIEQEPSSHTQTGEARGEDPVEKWFRRTMGGILGVAALSVSVAAYYVASNESSEPTPDAARSAEPRPVQTTTTIAPDSTLESTTTSTSDPIPESTGPTTTTTTTSTTEPSPTTEPYPEPAPFSLSFSRLGCTDGADTREIRVPDDEYSKISINVRFSEETDPIASADIRIVDSTEGILGGADGVTVYSPGAIDTNIPLGTDTLGFEVEAQDGHNDCIEIGTLSLSGQFE